MNPDKRKFERFNLTLPAKLEVVAQNDNSGEILDLTTKDICEGGACFFSSQPLAEGTDVRVHLTLPLNGLEMVKEKSASMRANGRVVRSGDEGLAVSFLKVFKVRPLGPFNSH